MRKTILLRRLLAIYAPTLVLALYHDLLTTVLPLYLVGLQTEYASIGLILAAAPIGMLLMDIPAGSVLRRLGTRTSLLLGASIEALAVLALFWASNNAEFFLYRLLAGMAHALWNLSRHVYLADITRGYQRGRAISLFGGVIRLGGLVGPALAGIVGSIYSLRTALLVAALLSLLALLLTALLVHPSETMRFRRAPASRGLPGWLELLQSQRHILSIAGTGYILAQMIRSARMVLIPLYGSNILGLSVGDIGWILSAAALLDMALFYTAGWLMDHLGRKYAIVPCFALQALGMVFVALSSDMGTLLSAVLLVGFGNGLGAGSMMTLGADLAPPEATGEFLGMWRLIGDSGMVASPLLSGAVASLFSLPLATLLMAATGFTAAYVFAYKVPETHYPDTRAAFR